MPWFKRKARPWDDHWDIFLLFPGGWIESDPYHWIVPDNQFLELTHLYLHVNFALLGPGTIHYPILSCIRGDEVRWSTGWSNRSIVGDSRNLIFANVPLDLASTVTGGDCYVPLPVPCHLIPGDTLELFWYNPNRGDIISSHYFTFKSWIIY